MSQVSASPSIDLNADLAEGFGRWSFGTDDGLLATVSSANVACGFHAGDPSVIRAALQTAATRQVRVGAHLGYPDLMGFGRRVMEMSHDELRDACLYQLSALAGLARVAGTRVAYVKPHGALYNRIAVDERQAAAVVEAVASFDPGLPLMGLPGSVSERLAREVGLDVIVEAYADRGYAGDGTLAPRSAPGGLLHDPEQVAERVVRMVTESRVTAVDGGDIEVRPDSICLHGDSPGALALAQTVRDALTGAGVAVRAPR